MAQLPFPRAGYLSYGVWASRPRLPVERRADGGGVAFRIKNACHFLESLFVVKSTIHRENHLIYAQSRPLTVSHLLAHRPAFPIGQSRA